MAAVDNPKYEELCRLCATKTTMVLAINIFENEGTIRQISKKICTCLPVQVSFVFIGYVNRTYLCIF